ncbi:MAG: hypothetical protein LBU60_06850 [Clostridiales bacterium]|jgi:hypothetical protein|nr:hypothetical protein [Clostridiales bacterium]
MKKINSKDTINLNENDILTAERFNNHEHDASKVSSGVLDTDRIPNIDASKVSSGVLDTDRIPNLNSNKILYNIQSVTVTAPGNQTNPNLTVSAPSGFTFTNCLVYCNAQRYTWNMRWDGYEMIYYNEIDVVGATLDNPPSNRRFTVRFVKLM